jgi:hypothetical protein
MIAVQVAIGTALMLATIALSGVSLWWVEIQIRRRRAWLVRRPHGPRLAVLLCAVAIWILGIVSFGVWLWALTFYGLGLFEGLEPAVYFALVSFTTLGYGDVLLPMDWRLLGGMAAANGFIMFGVLIASLTEALRAARLAQIAGD